MTHNKITHGVIQTNLCLTFNEIDDLTKHFKSNCNGLIGLTICHLNMISLVKNIEKLEDFLDNFAPKPDIICISETRTNASNVELVSLPGYNFFCNHSNTKAGGAGVYVVESLKSYLKAANFIH